MAQPTSITRNLSSGILVLTFSRPEQNNAMTQMMKEELIEALADASRDDAVRAVILTGSGNTFCMGDSMLHTQEAPPFSHGLIESIITCRRPVIAAINGMASGIGLAMTLACDMRLASETARLRFSADLPDAADRRFAAALLRNHIGISAAAELAYTEITIASHDAVKIGLIHKVVPGGDLLQACRKLATDMTRQLPVDAIAELRSLIWSSALCERMLRERTGIGGLS